MENVESATSKGATQGFCDFQTARFVTRCIGEVNSILTHPSLTLFEEPKRPRGASPRKRRPDNRLAAARVVPSVRSRILCAVTNSCLGSSVMNQLTRSLFLLCCAIPLVAVQAKADENPGRVVQAGVPQGTVTAGRFSESKLFPGTRRNYSVYVPRAVHRRPARGVNGVHGWQRVCRPQNVRSVCRSCLTI